MGGVGTVAGMAVKVNKTGGIWSKGVTCAAEHMLSVKCVSTGRDGYLHIAVL